MTPIPAPFFLVFYLAIVVMAIATGFWSRELDRLIRERHPGLLEARRLEGVVEPQLGHDVVRRYVALASGADGDDSSAFQSFTLHGRYWDSSDEVLNRLAWRLNVVFVAMWIGFALLMIAHGYNAFIEPLADAPSARIPASHANDDVKSDLKLPH